ncbi:MAG: polymerase subunit gamma and tau, partial [Solirubrobacterales bacterium]|nr:polymerase subunit gamma and tau [Solirubrobacterales bacterium]
VREAVPAPAPVPQSDPGPEPESAAPLAAPVATMDREADLDGVLAVWPAVLDSLREDHMALAAALAQGRPVDLDGKELVVAFRPSDSFKRRKAESQSQLVGNAVRELSGASLRLRFEERELPDAVEDAGPPPTSDDLINRLKSEFDAEEILSEEEPPA